MPQCLPCFVRAKDLQDVVLPAAEDCHALVPSKRDYTLLGSV
jgi:hypothetical protein